MRSSCHLVSNSSLGINYGLLGRNYLNIYIFPIKGSSEYLGKLRKTQALPYLEMEEQKEGGTDMTAKVRAHSFTCKHTDFTGIHNLEYISNVYFL